MKHSKDVLTLRSLDTDLERLLGVLDLSSVPVFIFLPLMKTKFRLSEFTDEYSSQSINFTQLIIDLQTVNRINNFFNLNE